MKPYPVSNPWLAATLLFFGFYMPKKGIFEDNDDLQRFVRRYNKRGITLTHNPYEMKIFLHHFLYLTAEN